MDDSVFSFQIGLCCALGKLFLAPSLSRSSPGLYPKSVTRPSTHSWSKPRAASQCGLRVTHMTSEGRHLSSGGLTGYLGRGQVYTEGVS